MLTHSINFLFNKSKYSHVISKISEISVQYSSEVYLVGGAVRDIILSRSYPDIKLSDLDFVVFGVDYIEFAKYVAGVLKSPAICFKDNIRIPWKGSYIDISSPRGADIYGDLLRRDFTINNLAMNLAGDIVGDPSDIFAKIIRPVNNNVFEDDPLRILRGFRQAAMLGFSLSDNFCELVTCFVDKLASIPQERVNDELKKISYAYDESVLLKMKELGVFRVLFGFDPEVSSLKASVECCRDDSQLCYPIFLASIFANRIDLAERCLNYLSPGNKVKSYVMLLLNYLAILTKTQDNKKRYLFKHYQDYELILNFSEFLGKITPLEKNEIGYIMSSANIDLAAQVKGDDILDLSSGRKAGKWIAALLEDAKVGLAFGRFKTKKDALDYIKIKLPTEEF